MDLIRNGFEGDDNGFNSEPILLRGQQLPSISEYLKDGILVMTPQTELRVRYWLLETPGLCLGDLIPRMLAKGLSYQVRVKFTDLARFIPPGVQLGGSKPEYMVNPDTLLVQGRTASIPEQLVKLYRRQLSDILRRPYARRFLTKGGLLWRIAREWGPPQLYAAALTGPSTDASIWHRDDHDYVTSTVDDEITSGDINALLGCTDNNYSFWPPLEYWNAWHNGEWSAPNEAWFLKHAEVIRSGSHGCARNRSQWRELLRPQRLKSPETPGSDAHANGLLKRLVEECPELWTGYDFVNLGLGPYPA